MNEKRSGAPNFVGSAIKKDIQRKLVFGTGVVSLAGGLIFGVGHIARNLDPKYVAGADLSAADVESTSEVVAYMTEKDWPIAEQVTKDTTVATGIERTLGIGILGKTAHAPACIGDKGQNVAGKYTVSTDYVLPGEALSAPKEAGGAIKVDLGQITTKSTLVDSPQFWNFTIGKDGQPNFAVPDTRCVGLLRAPGNIGELFGIALPGVTLRGMANAPGLAMEKIDTKIQEKLTDGVLKTTAQTCYPDMKDQIAASAEESLGSHFNDVVKILGLDIPPVKFEVTNVPEKLAESTYYEDIGVKEVKDSEGKITAAAKMSGKPSTLEQQLKAPTEGGGSEILDKRSCNVPTSVNTEKTDDDNAKDADKEPVDTNQPIAED